MRCQVVRDYLQDLLEERLPSPVAVNVRQHLSSCPVCGNEYESWRRLWSELNGLALYPWGVDLESRIMAAVEQGPLLPRGLLLLFAAGSLGTLGCLFSWADGLGAERSLVSAFLWILAGLASVCGIWFAVVRSYRLEAAIPVREE
ncbi:MAG: anti-sigma factor family protein [Bacteroidota bacterium]